MRKSYTMRYIGAHVSIAGGVDNAAQRAHTQGCEVMQIFVQSPQTFKTPETTPGEAEKFRNSLKKHKIRHAYVHAPYLINLASANNRTKYGSITLLRKNLERASDLGCTALMTHLGSYGEQTQAKGLQEVIKSLKKEYGEFHRCCAKDIP